MDAMNYDQAEEGMGTQRQLITIQDMSHCNVPPFKAHIMAAWLKRDARCVLLGIKVIKQKRQVITWSMATVTKR